MIQKGIIKQLLPDSNRAIVRIPMYETSQSNAEALFECILSCTPGIINGYELGDVVFVAFENGELDYPVIIGKLYLGPAKEESSKTSVLVDYLRVEGKTELSEDFQVGNISYEDLLEMKKRILFES